MAAPWEADIPVGAAPVSQPTADAGDQPVGPWANDIPVPAAAPNLPGYVANPPAVTAPPELPGMHGARVLGSNLIGGALDLAGTPGNVGNALPQLSPEEGGGEGLAGLLASMPTSAYLRGKAKELGLIDQPNQQPDGTGEQLLAAVGRGVGGTAPLGLFSGPAGVLKAGLQGGLSSLGGEAAQDLLPTKLQPAGTLAGILAGQGVGGALYGAAGRGVNALRGTGNPIVEAYDTAGVTPRLAGDVTGNPLLQGLQSIAMKAPFGGRAVEAAREGAQEFGNAFEDTAASLGSSRSLQEAGTALRKEGQAWLDNFKSDSKTAWNKVDAVIPANTPVPLPNYTAMLNDVRTQMPNAPATASKLEPSLSRDLLDALTTDTRIPPRNTGLLNASGQPIIAPAQSKPLTWQDVKAIRTQIGEHMEEPQPVGDTSYVALKRLYGSLSNDLQSAAAGQGSAAQDAFNQASALTSSGHSFIEGTLSKVMQGDKISPEQAANGALNSGNLGGTLLQSIRSQMPTGADELAAAKLRDMVQALPGRQTADMPTSATTFSTSLNQMSPEARQALFGAIEPKLSALQTVAERGKETFARYGNPSGTSGASAHLGLLTAPVAVEEAARLGHETGGLAGALAGGTLAALPYATGPVLSNLTAREGLARYLAAPVGGPGVGASRLFRAAAAGEALQPGERGR
jgi:hypothetical protein